jgi:penicillin-binding protein 1A
MSTNLQGWKKYLIIFWTLFSIPFLVMILLFILLSSGKLGYVPTFEDLENPKNNLASEVYSADEVLLGTVHQPGKCPDSHRGYPVSQAFWS